VYLLLLLLLQGSGLVPLTFNGGPAKQVVCTGTHFLALLESGWVVQREHPLMGSSTLSVAVTLEHQVLPPQTAITAIAANDLYSAALSGTPYRDHSFIFFRK
jgi:hypothetical protein